MNTKAKWTIFLWTFFVMLSALLLSSCGYHYKCGTTFGSASCTSSGSGLGTTGSASGNTAFAYNIVSSGTVNGISLSGGTNPTLQNISGFTAQTVPSGDQSAEIVVVPKKFVYAVFPLTQLLFGWSINSTSGNLTPVSGSPYTISSAGGMIVNTTGVNFNSIAVSPAGNVLYIASAGFGEIDAYQIGPAGALTQVSGAPFSTGAFGPLNLSFDGLGKYLYATAGPEGLGQQVAAYSIGSSGALTVVPGSPFAFNMWQMQGDPSGQFMIGISGRSFALNGLVDDKSLYVFSIQQTGTNAGALTQVSGSPFLTVSAPINLAVQPVASNGNFVYTFSVSSPVEGYQLDTTSGALTALTTSPFGNLGAAPWGQFDQGGANLFILGSTGTSSSLGVLSAASGTGNLTEPTSVLSIGATTYFAVTDAP